MTGFITLLTLVTFSYSTVEGFVFHIVDPTGSENVYPNVTVNDPRCKEDGVFGNLNDCTSYHACQDGNAQDRPCPEGMRFDSYRLCTFEEDADCGIRTSELDCPETSGQFTYPGDCFKYIFCKDGKPYVRDCPVNTLFSQTVGCSEYNDCLAQTPDPSCARLSGVFPHTGDCKKYIKCINGEATVKECPSDRGFDTEKRRCTTEKAACR